VQIPDRRSHEFFLTDRFQDPKVYVNTILEVHKKYNALVLIAFNNDSGFVAALDKACGRFINANAVTKKANSSSKSPELLAKYCDLLLKKSSKNPEEAELEDTLNQVVGVSRGDLRCRNDFF
jgi:cullin 1